jgi:hypothetical protein
MDKLDRDNPQDRVKMRNSMLINLGKLIVFGAIAYYCLHYLFTR